MKEYQALKQFHNLHQQILKYYDLLPVRTEQSALYLALSVDVLNTDAVHFVSHNIHRDKLMSLRFQHSYFLPEDDVMEQLILAFHGSNVEKLDRCLH